MQLHVHAPAKLAGIPPQVLQNLPHLLLATMFAIAAGVQLVPQDLTHCSLAHFTGLNFVEPGTQGQHALVPVEMTILTAPPATKLQTSVCPIAPITVRGVATIEPKITGGA